MLVRELRGRALIIAALVAALAAAFALTSARAEAAPASPVLEFVAPSFPVPFTADGGEVTAVMAGYDTVIRCGDSSGSGQITGPRSTLSSYVFTGCGTLSGSETGNDCKSASAEAGEIRSGQIEADLVFINQSTHQVGMLLAPHGGVYLTFECGSKHLQAIGPFLSPVGPINQMASSFTASLDRVGMTQVPDQYEGPAGEPLGAVPTGIQGAEPPASTGVELDFNIHTAVPIEVRALSSADVELARLNDELTALTAKTRLEEGARAAAEKRARDETAVSEALAQLLFKERAHAAEQARTRARERTKLRRCRKLKAGAKRTKCEERAKKHSAGAPPASGVRPSA